MWMLAIVPFLTMPFFIMGLLADELTASKVPTNSRYSV
jgi:hypothetical protein